MSTTVVNEKITLRFSDTALVLLYHRKEEKKYDSLLYFAI